jgi:hypothetical protein
MTPFWTQFLVSLTAIGLMVGLAAWAKIARPLVPLTPDWARQLLAQDFPGEALGPVWIDEDGSGAIARSRDLALVLFRMGDGYVSRSLAWAQVARALPEDGKLTISFEAFDAPKA